MTEKVALLVFLAALVLAFVGEWENNLDREEPVTYNAEWHVFGYIPKGVELLETECGYCFVRPAK